MFCDIDSFVEYLYNSIIFSPMHDEHETTLQSSGCDRKNLKYLLGTHRRSSRILILFSYSFQDISRQLNLECYVFSVQAGQRDGVDAVHLEHGQLVQVEASSRRRKHRRRKRHGEQSERLATRRLLPVSPTCAITPLHNTTSLRTALGHEITCTRVF